MALRPIVYATQMVFCGLALFALREPSGCCATEQETAPVEARGLAPHLAVDRKDEGRLHPGAVVQPGDVVQVSYVAAGHDYGVVVSIDGRGGVTLHHPPRPQDVPRVKARGEIPLNHAFELDDAPGFERFFFVTASGHPPEPEAVMDAARRLATAGFVAARVDPLPLPEDLSQTSFLLRKAP